MLKSYTVSALSFCDTEAIILEFTRACRQAHKLAAVCDYLNARAQSDEDTALAEDILAYAKSQRDTDRVLIDHAEYALSAMEKLREELLKKAKYSGLYEDTAMQDFATVYAERAEKVETWLKMILENLRVEAKNA